MAIVLDTNPLREGLIRERAVEPMTVVIFGGTGDLAHRKLMPALFSLYCQGLLPQGFAVIALGRTSLTTDEYAADIRKSVEKSGELIAGSCAWDGFAEGIKYLSMDYSDPESYDGLREALAWASRERGTCENRLFYLAIPPSGFETAVRNLENPGLAKSKRGWTRVVIEKPFGTDLQSARQLNSTLLDVFREDQIYRIDHYLGKETVQNILVFRFANSIFEPIWNQKYIDHVQITIAETLGVEERGEFYERTGALRDIIQNHALQLLSLVAMEPPATLDPNDIRDEKAKVFKDVRRISVEDVDRFAVRGQYGSGYFLGEWVHGYREEDEVDPNSGTETFVALELYIDNWRWSGVPFYIRTGKRLPRKSTEIAIQFKEVPDVLFKRRAPEQVEPNVLAIKVQPDEGITFKAESKVPGLAPNIRPVQLDFRYGSAFGAPVPEAYERLLLDAALGDASLYGRRDGVEECWEIVAPILNAWESSPPEGFPNYRPGTWGPEAAFDLMARSGRRWRRV